MSDIVLTLDSPVKDMKGVGPAKSKAFERLGLERISDVLGFYPMSYEDLRSVKKIADLEDGEKTLVEGVVLTARPGRGYGRKRTLHLLVEDSSGRLEIIFFMAGYMLRTFSAGSVYHFFGRVKKENGRAAMFQPTYSPAESSDKGIYPVYHLTKGLTQKDIRKLSAEALRLAESGGLEETLPPAAVERARLCPICEAYRGIHYPKDEKDYRQARYRLIYEEFFYLKTAMLMSRNRALSGRRGIAFRGRGAQDFISELPYELTGAQKRALSQILGDMSSDKPMNRLVQGDVGSGKTVVAEAAFAQAASCGYQGAFMAPTDILAKQHFETLSKDLSPFGYKVGLLCGSLSAKERKAAVSGIASGEIDIAVGTHALISDDVVYKDLGLVVTDEQHRFGVSQRQKLSAKGESPDVLVMTATPIPRTLAAVLYADLDVTVIDELPPGRQPVKTEKFGPSDRVRAYARLAEEVRQGRQAYVIAPFIDDSDSLDGRSAESLFTEFRETYPDISCALLHGEMSPAEKNEVLQSFYEGRVSVLISTVVIEVGINVPNATVMLIENCERFGLAQLHQLRGRVGRGSHSSLCFLINYDSSEIARERAELLCSTGDGFVIAEKDLEMRGPGELFGYKQHGIAQLNVADPVKHSKIASAAGEDAALVLSADPELESPENARFSELLRARYSGASRLTL